MNIDSIELFVPAGLRRKHLWVVVVVGGGRVRSDVQEKYTSCMKRNRQMQRGMHRCTEEWTHAVRKRGIHRCTKECTHAVRKRGIHRCTEECTHAVRKRGIQRSREECTDPGTQRCREKYTDTKLEREMQPFIPRYFPPLKIISA